MIALTHGSADSTDHDRMYVFGDKPSARECQLFCAQTDENRNLMVLSEDGVVRECYKGLPDEINNGLLATVHLHPQTHPNPITRPVTRVIPLKAARAVRLLLTRMTRSPYRATIKPALGSLRLRRRLEALSEVDFTQVPLSVDARKSQAFQIGQTLSLLDGAQWYTKHDIAQAWPSLRPLLARDPDADLMALNHLRDRLVERVGALTMTQDGPLVHLSCAGGAAPNTLEAQARGMLLDLKAERVVAWPPDQATASLALARDPATGARRVIAPGDLSPEVSEDLRAFIQTVPDDTLTRHTLGLVQDKGAWTIRAMRDLWTGDVVVWPGLV